MSDARTEPSHSQAAQANDDASADSLTRFLLQHAGVRGVRVHLDAAWQQIRERAEYPVAVRELLG